MTLQQPMMVRHQFPGMLQLLVAAVLGAVLMFGVLLAAGGTVVLPWDTTAPATDQGQVTWMTPAYQEHRQGERLGQ